MSVDTWLNRIIKSKWKHIFALFSFNGELFLLVNFADSWIAFVCFARRKMLKLNCMANCGILRSFLTICCVEGDEQQSTYFIKVHTAHCSVRIDLHVMFPYWSSSGDGWVSRQTCTLYVYVVFKFAVTSVMRMNHMVWCMVIGQWGPCIKCMLYILQTDRIDRQNMRTHSVSIEKESLSLFSIHSSKKTGDNNHENFHSFEFDLWQSM